MGKGEWIAGGGVLGIGAAIIAFLLSRKKPEEAPPPPPPPPEAPPPPPPEEVEEVEEEEELPEDPMSGMGDDGLDKRLAEVADYDVVRAVIQLQRRDGASYVEDAIRGPESHLLYKHLDLDPPTITVVTLMGKLREMLTVATLRPYIYGIWMDTEVTAFMHSVRIAMKADIANQAGFTGQGQTAAVIDTGINAQHPALQGVVKGFYDATQGKEVPAYDDFDPVYHGTHVAGAIAGRRQVFVDANGRQWNIEGIAPAASLVGVKVLGADGSGYGSDIVEGMEWVFLNKARFGIKAANFSLGGGNFFCLGGCYLCQKARSLASSGIHMFVAAGNEGPRSYTVSCPGKAPGVVTVAAVNDAGTIAKFSSRGGWGMKKPDIAAVGVDVVSASKGNLFLQLSGTSMATPTTTGGDLLLLQKRPAATQAQILQAFAASVQLAGRKYQTGAGFIDLAAALNALQ